MERINHKVHLSYKDVLLIPYDDSPCTIQSRSDPDISSDLAPGYRLKYPIVSAPMDTITGINMAVQMIKLGCGAIYTRHINDEKEHKKQMDAIYCISERLEFEKLEKDTPDRHPIACAMGVKNNVKQRAEELIKNGANIICLDIANGNHIFMINAIKELCDLKGKYNQLEIIAGNVATPKSAIRLAEAGASAVKIGIGPGGGCTTRRVTGIGVPQLTAVMNCAPVLRERGVKVIADGGIRYSGDAAKALWAGADTVMMGYVLAGHSECPMVSDVGRKEGSSIGIPKRMYRGMASRTVSGRMNVAAEGVVMEVSQKGSVEETVTEYAAAIKSTCSYGNANNLQELRRNIQAIRVSTMSQEESDPMGGL